MGTDSGLFYYGTREDIRLGDRVLIKRFLRAPLQGTVCYIPGLSTRHDELEYEDVKQWAIKTIDGAVYPILYDPEHFQPPKRIVLVERGSWQGITPDEQLG